MLAMVLDSVLSLSESKTPAAQNFALMYLLLMNVLVFSVLYYHILENLAAVLFHATAVKIILHSGLHISSICPPTYQQVAFLAVELILVVCAHLIVTRIGFWYI